MENKVQQIAENTRCLILKNGEKRYVPKKRPISVIAADIKKNWKNVYFGAEPYLQAMSQIDSIDGKYLYENASDIVIYFLSNATYWKGTEAQFIKAELKAQLKDYCNIKI